LGISGSLRRASFNTYALRAAADLLPPSVSFEIFELSNIPIFNQDSEDHLPGAVADLKETIRSADALLIATPEHNYSIPAALKNALDWGSRPHGDNAWSGKPAAIMGAALGGVGTARAQYHLRQMFVYLNIFAVNQPEVMITDAANRFDENGRLIDETTRKHIGLLIESLVEWTARLKCSLEYPSHEIPTA
jgi:chromate reductase